MNYEIVYSEVRSASRALANVLFSAETLGQAIDPNVKNQLLQVNQMLDEITFAMEGKMKSEQS